jgi:hypothetical protein
VPYVRRLFASFPPRCLRFEPRSGHVGFTMDKAALGQAFSENFGFPWHSFRRLLHAHHHHLPSGAGIIGEIVADVLSGLKSHWLINWFSFFASCIFNRPPLWSSGQSSWLHNGDVLCFLWGTNLIYICYVEESRPPLWSSDQSSWLQIRRPGFNSRHYKKKVVGLERGALSLVSTTEELLDRKVAAPV